MMRLASGLIAALAPGLLAAQEVSECGAVPVTDLIEPWEDTTAALADGAVRLAVIEGEEGTRRLLVLTLPAPEAGPDGTVAAPDPAAPPPERACRIVVEGGLGFADLDLAGLASEEDAAAGTLVVRLPALHFVPESTELAPEELVLTFGVADGSLAARIEGDAAAEEGPGGADGTGDGEAPDAGAGEAP